MSNDKIRITQAEVDAYKREILQSTVVVTVETAAEILSCSVRHVKTLMDEGHLTRHNRHAGRAHCNGDRILAAELQEYVRSIRMKEYR